MKISTLLTICFLLLIAHVWADDLGPNGELFAQIRNLWLRKDQHELLNLMDVRVRMNLSKSDERYPQNYPAEQAAGILKEHFLEVKILKFSYCHKRMHLDRGVAFYQYQINTNGIIKNKMLYFYLQHRPDGQWLINSINQIDCP